MNMSKDQMRIHGKRIQSIVLVFSFCHDTTKSMINPLTKASCLSCSSSACVLRKTTETIPKYIDSGGQICHVYIVLVQYLRLSFAALRLHIIDYAILLYVQVQVKVEAVLE